jgi:hypothetical protein
MNFLNIIGFGLIDNGILVGGAILGFSLEDLINRVLELWLEKSKYSLHTRVKGLSGSLLGAGLANAISDFLGGWCIGWQMAFGSFIGCMLIVILTLPIIFKLELK